MILIETYTHTHTHVHTQTHTHTHRHVHTYAHHNITIALFLTNLRSAPHLRGRLVACRLTLEEDDIGNFMNPK